MEHTFIGAYIALLIGYLIMDNKNHEAIVRQYLPQGHFKSFIAVLEKFFNFMKMTATVRAAHCFITTHAFNTFFPINELILHRR